MAFDIRSICTLFDGKLNKDVHVKCSSLVSGFEMDLIRILEKMSSNKALKYLNLGQNMRQR